MHIQHVGQIESAVSYPLLLKVLIRCMLLHATKTKYNTTHRCESSQRVVGGLCFLACLRF